MALAEMDMRDAVFGVIEDNLNNGEDIYVLTGDFGSIVLDRLKQNFPDRALNMGICEQSMVSVAAGLALAGKRVFTYSIASFMTLRCLEQIKIDLCCMDLPVTLVGVGAGFAYSGDGPTHHATEDLAALGALANIRIYAPSDCGVAAEVARARLRDKHPAYLRLDRGKTEIYPERVEDGVRFFGTPTDGATAICSCGIRLTHALKIRDMLINAGFPSYVIDICQVKPLPTRAILPSLESARLIASIEEHSEHGGLGDILARELNKAENINARFVPFGIDEENIYAYGNREDLYDKANISTGKIYEILISHLNK